MAMTTKKNDISKEVNELCDLELDINSMPEDSELIIPDVVLSGISGEDNLTCKICGTKFDRISNLKKHCRDDHNSIHPEIFRAGLGKIKCAFKSECSMVFHRTALYRTHLQVVHGIKIQKLIMQFESFDDFLTWKIQEESETSSKFIRSGRIQDIFSSGVMDIKKAVYNCHRTGEHRVLKGVSRQKSLKMDACCPAKMDVFFSKDRTILVYFKTHAGHGSISEIYKTSERKRMRTARCREKKKYKTAKENIKQLLEKFLKDLNGDKFSIDYLHFISKKLEYILAPAILSGENRTENKPCDTNKDTNEVYCDGIVDMDCDVQDVIEIDLETDGIASLLGADSVNENTSGKGSSGAANVILVNVNSSNCDKVKPSINQPVQEVSLQHYQTLTESVFKQKAPAVSVLKKNAVLNSLASDSSAFDHSYDLSARLFSPKKGNCWSQRNGGGAQQGYQQKIGKVLSASSEMEKKNYSTNSYVLRSHFMDLMQWDNQMMPNKKKFVSNFPIPPPAPPEVRKRYDSLWDSFRNK